VLSNQVDTYTASARQPRYTATAAKQNQPQHSARPRKLLQQASPALVATSVWCFAAATATTARLPRPATKRGKICRQAAAEHAQIVQAKFCTCYIASRRQLALHGKKAINLMPCCGTAAVSYDKAQTTNALAGPLLSAAP
jgi:hypothetical protein